MSFQADAFQNDAFQVAGSFLGQSEVVTLLDSQTATVISLQSVSDSIAVLDSQSALSFQAQVQSENVTIADNQSAIMTATNIRQAETIAVVDQPRTVAAVITVLQQENLGFRLVVDVEDFASAPLSYGTDAITGLPDRFSYRISNINDVSVAELVLNLNLASDNIGVADVISADVIRDTRHDQHDGLIPKPYPKKHKYDLIAPELHRKAKLRKDLIMALQDGSYLPDLLGPSNKTVQLQRPHPPELPQLSSPPVQVGDLSRVIVSLRQSPNDDEEAIEALLRVL